MQDTNADNLEVKLDCCSESDVLMVIYSINWYFFKLFLISNCDVDIDDYDDDGILQSLFAGFYLPYTLRADLFEFITILQ